MIPTGGRPPSNYDRMRDAMERKFLTYPQEEMIRRFHLEHDAAYLYLRFVGRRYRVGRATGRVETDGPDGDHRHADYNVSMTVFDVLCESRPDCSLSGKFVSLGGVRHLTRAASPGGDLFAPAARQFAGRCDALRAACLALGGLPRPVGDVAFQLPLFDFLPVVLQFWDADEEFGPVLKLMWDENILEFLHFETTFFAASHLLSRLLELSGRDAAADR